MVRQSSNRVLELDAVPYRNSGAESATNPGRPLQLRFLVLKCSGALFKDFRNSLGNAAMQGVERYLENFRKSFGNAAMQGMKSKLRE